MMHFSRFPDWIPNVQKHVNLGRSRKFYNLSLPFQSLGTHLVLPNQPLEPATPRSTKKQRWLLCVRPFSGPRPPPEVTFLSAPGISTYALHSKNYRPVWWAPFTSPLRWENEPREMENNCPWECESNADSYACLAGLCILLAPCPLS